MIYLMFLLGAAVAEQRRADEQIKRLMEIEAECRRKLAAMEPPEP